MNVPFLLLWPLYLVKFFLLLIDVFSYYPPEFHNCCQALRFAARYLSFFFILFICPPPPRLPSPPTSFFVPCNSWTFARVVRLNMKITTAEYDKICVLTSSSRKLSLRTLFSRHYHTFVNFFNSNFIIWLFTSCINCFSHTLYKIKKNIYFFKTTKN